MLQFVRWLCVLSAGGVVLIGAARAQACSCSASTIESYVQKADLVFEGRVLAVDKAIAAPVCDGFCDQALQVRLGVVQRWKGEVAETMTIHTRAAESTCGFPFELRRSYLVYAVRRGDGWLVHLCGGTRPRENADEHLRVLQAGVIPVDPKGSARATATTGGGGPPRQTAGCQSCSLTPSAAGLPLSVVGVLCGVVLAVRRARRRGRRP